MPDNFDGSNYGPNGEQVVSLLQTLSRTQWDDVQSVLGATEDDSSLIRARGLAFDAPRSRRRTEAIEAVSRELHDDLQLKLPEASDRTARQELVQFFHLLNAALHAIEARRELGDELVAQLVDPIATHFTWEWRDWGVHSHGMHDDIAQLEDQLRNEEQGVEYRDSYVNREHQFSLGHETLSGAHYLSIPVSLGAADVERYFLLTKDEAAAFAERPLDALPLIEQLRAGGQQYRHISDG